MDEEYYTIPEVAKKLKVTRGAIYLWIKQGRMDVVYVGSERRVTGSAIEAFIQASSDAAKTGRGGTMEDDTQTTGYAAPSLGTA